MTTATTRQRLYGCFRVIDRTQTASIRWAGAALGEFAESGGFEVVDIYEGSGPGQRLEVRIDMVESCGSDDVAAVVALSLDSFHPTPALATFMREELAERIKGTVLIATLTPGTADHDG
jgi:hypothetical protein